MKIIDVFDYEGKQAVYLSVDCDEAPQEFSKIVIKNKQYTISKFDKTCSIAGKNAIIVLIDSFDEFRIGTSVELK